MFNNPLKKSIFIFSLTLLLSTLVFAGTITPPTATPTPTMYTISDIYELIHNNTITTEGNHSLSPTTDPITPSSYSLSQIYADLANLIQREDIVTDTTYLGITGDFDNPDPDRINVPVISSSLTPTTPSPEAIGYTLEDIYNLITINATTTPDTHDFSPSTTPDSTMYTLTDIYEALVDLIDPTQVRLGVTYLGVEGSYEVNYTDLPQINGDNIAINIYPTDNLDGTPWGCNSTVIGALDDDDGENNTILATACTAPKICADLNFGGYTDWYLPARNELIFIYNHLNSIDYGEYTDDWVDFQEDKYWSSTEFQFTPATAVRFVDFSDGMDFKLGKNDLAVARCIRSENITTYSVTYDGNGSDGGTVPSDLYYYESNDNVTILDNTGNLTKTSYTFTGWNTQADGLGTTYTAGDPYTMGTSNVTLYAKWEEDLASEEQYWTLETGGDDLFNDQTTACDYFSNLYAPGDGVSTFHFFFNGQNWYCGERQALFSYYEETGTEIWSSGGGFYIWEGPPYLVDVYDTSWNPLRMEPVDFPVTFTLVCSP